MTEAPRLLSTVYAGWEGYNASLIGALQARAPAELAWRAKADLRSVGEIARHIALGRVAWFVRMDAPGSAEAAAAIPAWECDGDGNRHPVEESLKIDQDAGALSAWLERSWQMVDATLRGWSVDDLDRRFTHVWNGQPWAISRQWVIFRILAHDIHHGGELSLMLGQQGIETVELGALGGHIVLPPPAHTPAAGVA